MMRTYEKLGIPEAERQYLAGVTAQYECLRGSTKVWTTRGMRAIKELESGDEVFSLDRGAREIVDVGEVEIDVERGSDIDLADEPAA
jgi:Fe-S cluster assembly protein SufB